MITEDYVSFETAKLLKERGFDEECRAFYVKSKECGIELFPAERSYNYNDDIYPRTSAPTLQMAMKWLRTKYKLHIEPCTTINNGVFTGKWHCYVHFLVGRTYPLDSDHVGENYTSYEEACEAAIKYCLENLI